MNFLFFLYVVLDVSGSCSFMSGANLYSKVFRKS